MNDTTSKGDKTIRVEGRKTLSLKGGSDVVRQSFSGGRSKSVVVEKKRRFVSAPNERDVESTAQTDTRQPAPAAQETAPQAAAGKPPVIQVQAPQPASPEPTVAAEPAAPATAPAAESAAPAAEAAASAPAATEAPSAPAQATPSPAAPSPAAPAPASRTGTVQPTAAQLANRAGGQPRQLAPAPAQRTSAAPAGQNRPAAAGRGAAGAGAGGRPQAQGPNQGQQQRRPEQRNRSGVVLRTLTADERDARTLALQEARVREARERIQAEEDAKRRAEEDVRLAKERAEAEARRAEEDARRASEDQAKKRGEEEARRRLGNDGGSSARPGGASSRPSGGASAPGVRPTAAGRPAGAAPRGPEAPSSLNRPKRIEIPKPARTKATPGGEGRRRLTVTNALETTEGDRERSLASVRRKREKQMRQQHGFNPSNEKIVRDVVIPEAISVQDLANRMAERAVDVIRLLMRSGNMVKITDILDADTAQLIAEEMGHNVRRVAASDVEEGLFGVADVTDDLQQRPPVVTIMGHVDHGKTSLLDAIRHANVVSGEAGGITQHIGAYQVEQNGQKITFIDTPGHEAFTAMRARGAQATDIVILVVAADDGVMPQTIEAINHARAANVPIIVAINKIDKPSADANHVRTELLRYEIQVESMGGDTLEVEVSATQKTNLDKLLEAILLQSEVLDLRANPERDAEGIVVEAQLDRGRGPVATLLVQRGTLHVGDIVVAGAQWGRVRALLNDRGEQVKEAGPSMPVEVLGFQGTPAAGDRLGVVENEARAREITEYREGVRREKQAASMAGARGSLEQMMSRLQTAGRKLFPVVVKGDVQGSVEAIVASLTKLGTEEVGAQILNSGVGGITESDVSLAAASKAPIIAFNVRASKQARDAATREGVEIRYYSIIYDLVDDIKSAMSGLLPPERRETFIGYASILEIFNITKVGKVAGCRVTEGKVERGSGVRLIRDNVVVHEGKLSTLKRFKDEVREVNGGQECGMAFERYEDMRVGDVIECFRVEMITRTL
ncbi:bacterial translation initiation factor 2 (bIF-2) [Faunimonas pinastri]|uniref:Translation initiation factor IF-2 n=1 Tax=Faunimonas pinastri TaxID=1855383 RepID=A0A1H9GM55_9HYPH|nr:translation initiation factor IF-2 [Faunimonas pinastri]SEQ51018.1 bacterial translation initiation factor 2 (bIF-2) [Faunimonas pinastri]